ncbi:hypothetical protein NMY22_g5758 [Coprinellus aureogranulatus]|nr:hypothetical protein NMY22_g5758 [Coprinellus aureogranulatus]
MRPQLPLEVLDLIVDFVSMVEGGFRNRDLLSLCYSARAFVARCQFYIFRLATLYPPSSIPIRLLPGRIVAEYRRTLLFARSVSGRPYLGNHVKELSIQLTSAVRESDEGFWDVLKAMDGMQSVQRLTLGFDESLPIAPFSAVTSRMWKRALGCLVRRPSVRHLILRNLMPFPVDLLLNASSLQAIELHNTGLTSSDHQHPHIRPPTNYLKSLTCDTVSLVANRADFLHPKSSTQWLDVSRLEFLAVTFSREVNWDLDLLEILRQSTRLRELHLTTIEYLDGHPMDCPLDELDDGSMELLTHLTFNTVVYLPWRGPVQGTLISLPYRSILRSKVFPNLRNLETLTIRVVFQGCLNVDPWSFGSQWGAIVEMVSKPQVFPKLRKVKIEVHARVLTDEDESLQRFSRYAVDGLVSAIERTVFPSYLAKAKALRRESGPVEFSFRTVKEEGSRLR